MQLRTPKKNLNKKTILENYQSSLIPRPDETLPSTRHIQENALVNGYQKGSGNLQPGLYTIIHQVGHQLPSGGQFVELQVDGGRRLQSEVL